MLESEVRKEIKEYLQRAGWFVFPVHQQGFRAYKGISDYIAIKSGKVAFIEVKKPGGKQSKDQIKFQQDVTDHRGNYFCVDSIESLIRYLGGIK